MSFSCFIFQSKEKWGNLPYDDDDEDEEEEEEDDDDDDEEEELLLRYHIVFEE